MANAMSKKINVLIFPAGEVNSVELHAALSSCVNIEVFGAASVDRHGPFIFRNYIGGLPFATHPAFYDELNKVIERYRIDVVFPTHDSVADLFSSNRNRIRAKVVVADPRTAEICRDKAKTYRIFSACDFTPTIYPEFREFPAFIKPIDGQGGQGARLVRSPEDVPHDIDLSRYVIQEYLPGEEYTVDCLTDYLGELRVISPRSRDRVMAGISVASKSRSVTVEVRHIAEAINAALTFRGLWFFQIKRDREGKWKLLEISTRCAGSMCLTRAMGWNLPLLSVYTALGYPVEILDSAYSVSMDRTLISRYKIDYDYSAVYFDFDDTLIINGKVHLPAIWFLYQCRNESKKVILVTRHEKDLDATLAEYCIPRALFSEIIHIRNEDSKACFVTESDAIFIDNSFKERMAVHRACRIPVFDVDALEVLMNWTT